MFLLWRQNGAASIILSKVTQYQKLYKEVAYLTFSPIFSIQVKGHVQNKIRQP